MSPRDLQRNRHRSTKTTRLFFGEGLGEAMFLKYIQKLYPNDELVVSIRAGRGGAPHQIVSDANNILGAFDSRIVVLDNDRPIAEIQRARLDAKKFGIELIENTPCLEALLLSILNNGADFSNKNSGWCKAEFESNFINRRKRRDLNEYIQIFPKPFLLNCESTIPTLARLIKLIKGI